MGCGAVGLDYNDYSTVGEKEPPQPVKQLQQKIWVEQKKQPPKQSVAQEEAKEKLHTPTKLQAQIKQSQQHDMAKAKNKLVEENENDTPVAVIKTKQQIMSNVNNFINFATNRQKVQTKESTLGHTMAKGAVRQNNFCIIYETWFYLENGKPIWR